MEVTRGKINLASLNQTSKLLYKYINVVTHDDAVARSNVTISTVL